MGISKRQTRRKRRPRRRPSEAGPDPGMPEEGEAGPAHASEVDPDGRMAVIYMRSRVRFDQATLAGKSRISASRISQIEQGEVAVPDEPLERTADATDFPRVFLAPLLHELRSFRLAVEGWSRIGRAPAGVAFVDGLALSAGVAEAVLAVRGSQPGAHHVSTAEDREQAAACWARLEKRTPEQRLALVEEAEEFRGWALVERVAAASIEAASDSPAEALERALLARRIAELGHPGEERQRPRNRGYAEFHVANILRVTNDLPGAEEALATAVQLWEAGALGDPGPFNEAIVLGLEANIHREHGRFAQALRRVDEALAADQGDLRGKLLLTKAKILEALGDTARSTAVLEEAVPLVNAEQAPRTTLGVWCLFLTNLCLEGRAAEAEPLLQPVRTLAERLGNKLDLTRVLWVEGKVWAGVKRTAEAEAAFDQVRRDFLAHELDFDYALVSLDKALLLLEQGRTREVRAMAEEMSAIFRRQRVARESLAALQIYWNAARREAVTVELTRQLVRFLHRAQHDSGLRFEAGEGTKGQ